MEKTGIDLLLIFSFDTELSQHSPGQFLRKLYHLIPFKYLNLGHDGRIGKDRQGDKEHLHNIATEMGFQLEYVSSIKENETIISSSLVRHKIQKGYLAQVSALLNRPYSIVGLVKPGFGIGREIGFRTANIDLTNLILPPTGVWKISAEWDGKIRVGITNLGHAPTLHKKRALALEVHLPDMDENLYGKELEVYFHQYLRPDLCS